MFFFCFVKIVFPSVYPPSTAPYFRTYRHTAGYPRASLSFSSARFSILET